jgi:hypothetical protein
MKQGHYFFFRLSYPIMGHRDLLLPRLEIVTFEAELRKKPPNTKVASCRKNGMSSG